MCEMHILPILVLVFSAIYSHRKVCRFISKADPSLSSYINKTSHMVRNSSLVLKVHLEVQPNLEISNRGVLSAALCGSTLKSPNLPTIPCCFL